MSIATLKIELANRSGREALPEFFPIDVLISVTRELAMVAGRAQSLRELDEIRTTIGGYLRKVLEMQGPHALASFEQREHEVISELVAELYEHVCAELVSKMIGYSVHQESLPERFSRCLSTDPNSIPSPTA